MIEKIRGTLYINGLKNTNIQNIIMESDSELVFNFVVENIGVPTHILTERHQISFFLIIFDLCIVMR